MSSEPPLSTLEVDAVGDWKVQFLEALRFTHKLCVEQGILEGELGCESSTVPGKELRKSWEILGEVLARYSDDGHGPNPSLFRSIPWRDLVDGERRCWIEMHPGKKVPSSVRIDVFQHVMRHYLRRSVWLWARSSDPTQLDQSRLYFGAAQRILKRLPGDDDYLRIARAVCLFKTGDDPDEKTAASILRVVSRHTGMKRRKLGNICRSAMTLIPIVPLPVASRTDHAFPPSKGRSGPRVLVSFKGGFVRIGRKKIPLTHISIEFLRRIWGWRASERGGFVSPSDLIPGTALQAREARRTLSADFKASGWKRKDAGLVVHLRRPGKGKAGYWLAPYVQCTDGLVMSRRRKLP